MYYYIKKQPEEASSDVLIKLEICLIMYLICVHTALLQLHL